ncbi:alpha/beta hydrolase [Halobaculum sp. MBLA0147]|uniref:alpha/beta hydrolase n=1 Tax=Halobaculum sp. MBLA0147 TaxID=3079934 RepID=UPI0035241B69
MNGPDETVDDTVDTSGVAGPHGGQPVVRRGPPLAEARAVVVCLHGRGATAQGILGVTAEFETPGVTALAPAAAGRTWYPRPFTAPTAENQPHLDSALSLVGTVVSTAVDAVGAERVVLLGFSQGACLATEWAARNPTRYGGVVGFSGGLIGPPGTEFAYEGSFARTGEGSTDGSPDTTPVFLGCSDEDPHIPASRVHETRDALAAMDADVDERLYPGMGHGVNEEELAAAAEIVARAAGE